MTMQLNEAMLSYQLRWIEAGDRLATTKQLLAYLTVGTAETETESFWIACMNPTRRPICRARLKAGVLVATQVNVREVFLTLLLAPEAFRTITTANDKRIPIGDCLQLSALVPFRTSMLPKRTIFTTFGTSISNGRPKLPFPRHALLFSNDLRSFLQLRTGSLLRSRQR